MVGRLLGIFILQKYSARQILTLCAIGGALLVGISLSIGASASVVALWLFLGTGTVSLHHVAHDLQPVA
jgi:fucose permease